MGPFAASPVALLGDTAPLHAESPLAGAVPLHDPAGAGGSPGARQARLQELGQEQGHLQLEVLRGASSQQELGQEQGHLQLEVLRGGSSQQEQQQQSLMQQRLEQERQHSGQAGEQGELLQPARGEQRQQQEQREEVEASSASQQQQTAKGTWHGSLNGQGQLPLPKQSHQPSDLLQLLAAAEAAPNLRGSLGEGLSQLLHVHPQVSIGGRLLAERQALVLAKEGLLLPPWHWSHCTFLAPPCRACLV